MAGAYGSGGTEMMKAIRTALGDDAGAGQPVSGAAQPLRVVCFMTDGYVGDDPEIVAAVQKHPEARVFAFGIGTAVNRFLLTKMAEEGHGEVEFVTNPDEAQPAADRFYERVHSPLLTNISIDWNGLPVTEIYPAQAPDLFPAKPIIVTGRYTRPATGSLVIHGTRAGGDFARTIAVDFPAENSSNAALEKIWARRKVEDLMSQDWSGIRIGQSKHKAEIIDVGLKHSLATQYTSFVAVETTTVIQDGKPVRIEVPVELPENVSPLAVPGEKQMGFYKVFSRSGTNGYSGWINARAATETIEVASSAPPVQTESAQGSYDPSPRLNIAPGRASGGPIPRAHGFKVKSVDKLPESKLSADLLSLYQCSQKRAANAAGEMCTLPASGTVEVQVKLTAGSVELDQKLIGAGLTIKTGAGTAMVSGEIAIEKLKALVEIAEVASVSKIEPHPPS